MLIWHMYAVLCQNTMREKEAIGYNFTYYLMEVYTSLRIYPILNITHDLLDRYGLRKVLCIIGQNIKC